MKPTPLIIFQGHPKCNPASSLVQQYREIQALRALVERLEEEDRLRALNRQLE